MKINLNKLCDIISKKYQIPRNDIYLKAWFPIPELYYKNNLPLGEDDGETDKMFLPYQYAELPQEVRELDIEVYEKKKHIMYITAKNVSPNKNKVYELMDLDYTNIYAGGGFYSHYPYFKINGCYLFLIGETNNKYAYFLERYSQFLTKTEIDTENITIDLVETDSKGFVTKTKRIKNDDVIM